MIPASSFPPPSLPPFSGTNDCAQKFFRYSKPRFVTPDSSLDLGEQEGHEEAIVSPETALPAGSDQPQDAGDVSAPLVENQPPALRTQVSATPADV